MVSSSTRSDLTKKQNAWLLVCLVCSEAVHTCLAEDKPYCDTSTYVLHLYGMKAQLESTSCIGSECLAPEFDIRRRDDKLSLKS